MRVLMTATSYPADAADWRGRFIYDLAAALARRADVSLELWAPSGDLPAGVRSALSGDDAAWLARLTAAGGIAHLLKRQKFRAAIAAAGLLRRLREAYRRSAPEVAHVNWLQNALPLAGTRTPAVVGVLGSDFGLLSVPGMAAALRRVFAGRRTVLAPNAEWMVPRLRSLFGEVAAVRAVPFGVDARWFDVHRASDATEPAPWLVVSRVTQAKLGDLMAWGEGVFGRSRPLVLLGPMQEQTSLPDWIDYRGPTNPTALREIWFPRAAGLVTLSRHNEGRPQVMIEAMAAGLPVVASTIPAHVDLLAGCTPDALIEDRERFAAILDHYADTEANARAGEAGRNWVRREVGTWDDCADGYARAYAEVGA